MKPNIKKAGVLLEINFHFFGTPASTPLVISGLQRSSQSRFTNCLRQVHATPVPQALKFQGPSLGLRLADFGRELLGLATPDSVFFGFSCFFLGGWGLVNLRELA